MTNAFAALETLGSVARRNVEAFMHHCLVREAEGMKTLFREDATFEGAFTGGALRGNQVIEAHFRQSFKGPYLKGVIRYHHLAIEGHQVLLEWDIANPDDATALPSQCRTTMELDESGHFARIKAEWDPRPLMGWKPLDGAEPVNP